MTSLTWLAGLGSLALAAVYLVQRSAGMTHPTPWLLPTSAGLALLALALVWGGMRNGA